MGISAPMERRSSALTRYILPMRCDPELRCKAVTGVTFLFVARAHDRKIKLARGALRPNMKDLFVTVTKPVQRRRAPRAAAR